MTRAELAARWGLPEESVPLRRALTHASATSDRTESNQRLEFLGDALLGAIVARLLFDRLPPETREGVLTVARAYVVYKQTLADAALRLGLDQMLQVGKGEEKEGRQGHVGPLHGAYEALVAAIYLERGEAAATEFVEISLAEPLVEAIAEPLRIHTKNRLQERLQAIGRGIAHYVPLTEDTPWRVAVTDTHGMTLAVGVGTTKSEASLAAAEAALAQLDTPV